MAEEKAKSEFENILNKIDRKFDIIAVKWQENKNFEVRFRTQIPRNNEDFNGLCDDYVLLFSDVTNTVWVQKVSNTGPKVKFRKQYQCWTHEGKEVKKELLFDARRCRGTLDIKVLTDNPLSRRKNRHIKLGMNVVVKINFSHHHDVDTSKPLAFFVHTCEPLKEVPKPVVHSNNKISEKVAEIIQKTLSASLKTVEVEKCKDDQPDPQLNSETISDSDAFVFLHKSDDKSLIENKLSIDNSIPPVFTQMLPNFDEISACINQNYLPVFNLDQVQLNPVIQLNSISDSIKLEIQPHVQQLNQVNLCPPQIGMTEPIMCQPTFMLDSQLLSFTTHHMVQMQNLQNQSNYYL